MNWSGVVANTAGTSSLQFAQPCVFRLLPSQYQKTAQDKQSKICNWQEVNLRYAAIPPQHCLVPCIVYMTLSAGSQQKALVISDQEEL